jgi:hypothetical protein
MVDKANDSRLPYRDRFYVQGTTMFEVKDATFEVNGKHLLQPASLLHRG